MNKLKLISGVTLIFLVGGLAGALGAGLYLKRGGGDFDREIIGPHRKVAMIMEKLSSRLDLTESQQAEIGKIVEESYAGIMAVKRRYLPEIKKIIDQRFEAINEKLTSEQQKKLAEIKQKIERRYEAAYTNGASGRDKAP